MKEAIVLCSILIFVCCKNNNIESNSSKILEKVTKQQRFLDTVITYTIGGLSSEGAEAKTVYIQSRISKSEVTIYGETGQIQIIYSFSDDTIDVFEKQFAYKEGILNANSMNDMVVKKEFSYKLNTSGKVLSKVSKERTDIFKEFREEVPFKLR